MIDEIGSKADLDNLIETGKVTVVYFYATWAGPCKRVEPVFKKLAEEFTAAAFCQVDCDKNAELDTEVGLTAIPTFLILKKPCNLKHLLNENVVVGANPLALQAKIRNALASE